MPKPLRKMKLEDKIGNKVRTILKPGEFAILFPEIAQVIRQVTPSSPAGPEYWEAVGFKNNMLGLMRQPWTEFHTALTPAGVAAAVAWIEGWQSAEEEREAVIAERRAGQAAQTFQKVSRG